MSDVKIEKINELGPDEEELRRLTIQHEVIKANYGNLILAPLDLSKPNLRILDSATANGLWLRDIQPSLTSPYALVGTDINPNLFPPSGLLNTTFQVQDITKPWPEDWTESFDLIHTRVGLAGCGKFPIEQAVKNMVALVKPGGWIQLDEMDVEAQSLRPGTAGELGRLILAIFAVTGADALFAQKMKMWLIEAGLENFEVKIIQISFGKTSSSPKIAKKGAQSLSLSAGAIAFGAKMLGVKELTYEEMESLPAITEKEMTEKGSFAPMLNVWRRKPLKAA